MPGSPKKETCFSVPLKSCFVTLKSCFVTYTQVEAHISKLVDISHQAKANTRDNWRKTDTTKDCSWTQLQFSHVSFFLWSPRLWRSLWCDVLTDTGHHAPRHYYAFMRRTCNCAWGTSTLNKCTIHLAKYCDDLQHQVAHPSVYWKDCKQIWKSGFGLAEKASFNIVH